MDKKKIIVIPDLANTSSEKTESIPTWVKNTAGWWADDRIADSEFLAGIYFLVENGLLIVDILEIAEMTEEGKKIADRNRWQFARYLDRIEKTVSDDKRYIEYPNPSGDVIKKFLRDPTAKRHYPALGKGTISGLIVECNDLTGLADKVFPVIIGSRLQNFTV